VAKSEYQRLTRTRSRSPFAFAWATRSSLWLGADHLLAVETNGFTETYKRFHFRDIQAITLVATQRRQQWNSVFGVLALVAAAVWGGVLLASGPSLSGSVVGALVVAVLFGVPLLVNNLLGPSCECRIHTAVQTEVLPSLRRLRRVQRLLERLRPLIAGAQGTLAPEEIPARMQQWFNAANEVPASPLATQGPAAADAPMPPRLVS
jgi:hypothetical protein